MKHLWLITGRDYSTGVANIWRCSNCGIVRAINYDDTTDYYLEFSDADGEVIGHSKKNLPPCKKALEDTWNR